MHYLYILYNTTNNKTYVGYTDNPARRLRQHNRIFAGGAKATSAGAGAWQFLVIISGFPDKINAMQCEWCLKEKAKKAPKSLDQYHRRINTLRSCLDLNRWTDKSVYLNKNLDLHVYVRSDLLFETTKAIIHTLQEFIFTMDDTPETNMKNQDFDLSIIE